MTPTNILGRSPQIKELLTKIEQIAPTNYPVLILGESGTGKELVAQAIHNQSTRKSESFVTINCNAISETLLESELFGHKYGSFTGATRSHEGKLRFANGGTVFLDEIGDISEAVQVKLLRVIENQEVQSIGYNGSHKIDVRFIFATNKNLTTGRLF